MNPDALLAHSAARTLPAGSKERSLALQSIRQIWHTIFDPCPKFSQLYADKDKEIFEPFVEFAAQKTLSMLWPLHAHLLLWLEQKRPAEMSPELSQELLAAAGARWANSDQSEAKGIILYFTGMPEKGVTAWKSRAIAEDHRIVLVGLSDQLGLNEGVFYSAFPTYKYEDALSWQRVQN